METVDRLSRKCSSSKAIHEFTPVEFWQRKLSNSFHIHRICQIYPPASLVVYFLTWNNISSRKIFSSARSFNRSTHFEELPNTYFLDGLKNLAKHRTKYFSIVFLLLIDLPKWKTFCNLNRYLHYNFIGFKYMSYSMYPRTANPIFRHPKNCMNYESLTFTLLIMQYRDPSRNSVTRTLTFAIFWLEQFILDSSAFPISGAQGQPKFSVSGNAAL